MDKHDKLRLPGCKTRHWPTRWPLNPGSKRYC